MLTSKDVWQLCTYRRYHTGLCVFLFVDVKAPLTDLLRARDGVLAGLGVTYHRVESANSEMGRRKGGFNPSQLDKLHISHT